MKPVFLFVLVGGIGLVIDTTVTTLFITLVGLTPAPAKIIGFLVAVVGTYVLNKRFTFADRGVRSAPFARYLAVQVIGSLINLGIFLFLLASFDSDTVIAIILCSATASLCAAVFNYLVLRRVVFSAAE